MKPWVFSWNPILTQRLKQLASDYLASLSLFKYQWFQWENANNFIDWSFFPTNLWSSTASVPTIFHRQFLWLSFWTFDGQTSQCSDFPSPSPIGTTGKRNETCQPWYISQTCTSWYDKPSELVHHVHQVLPWYFLIPQWFSSISAVPSRCSLIPKFWPREVCAWMSTCL